MKPSVTVVTPWWNHRELELDYWAAIRAANAEVIVIDNGSDPPLPNGWRLPTNAGFSHACNVGLDLAQGDAVLFLNNDVRMTRANWLQDLLAKLERGFLVGANLRFDRHGAVDGQQLPYLDGWCLAGMRDDLVALGGFDEGYDEPAYYSDNDLSLRARASGLGLREADVGLLHLANRTAGPCSDPGVLAASAANRERFAARARELMEVAA